MTGGPFLAVLAVTALLLTAAAAARGTWSPCGLSMISAINPFSERSRGHRYWATAAWFVAGAVAGGGVLGGLGALGAGGTRAAGLPATAACAVAALCCLAAAAGDAESVAVRLPLIPRQVDERWLSGYRRWFYASGFGAQIGFGLATYVMTAAVFLVPVLGALSGSPLLALSGGLLFGLVRGLAILLTAGVRSPAGLRALHRRLAVLAPRSVRAMLVVELAAAVLFALLVGRAAAALAVAGIAGTMAWTRRGADRALPASSTAR